MTVCKLHISGRLHLASALLFAIALNCCTCISKNETVQNKTNKVVRPLPEIPLPPGTADVQAWMQDYSEEENSFLCKLKVSEVDGYGPATPPLPQGYVMTLYISKSLLKKNNYDADKIFLKGKLIKMRVRYEEPMLQGDSLERWIAMGFSNLTK